MINVEAPSPVVSKRPHYTDLLNVDCISVLHVPAER